MRCIKIQFQGERKDNDVYQHTIHRERKDDDVHQNTIP